MEDDAFWWKESHSTFGKEMTLYNSCLSKIIHFFNDFI